MIPEEGQGKGRILGGLGPLFSGLIAATLIALTLLVAVALGMGEQALTARVEPTATEALAPPALTLVPLPTYTPLPAADTPLPDADMPSPPPTSTVSPTPTATATPTSRLALTPTKTRRPAFPTSTPVRISKPCSPSPLGWTRTWVVKRNQTLYYIAGATGTTVLRLKRGNCLTSDTIYEDWRLWVPGLPTPTATRIPTRTPTVTPTGPTDTPTVTPSPTPTATLGGPTDTPTPELPTKTPTPVPPPTNTPTPVPPPTNTPTPVPPPTNTPTPVPPPTKTPTPIPEPETEDMRGLVSLLAMMPAGAFSPLPPI